jgi:hypothetical protein
VICGGAQVANFSMGLASASPSAIDNINTPMIIKEKRKR